MPYLYLPTINPSPLRGETDAGVIATLKRKGWVETAPPVAPADQPPQWDGDSWVIPPAPVPVPQYNEFYEKLLHSKLYNETTLAAVDAGTVVAVGDTTSLLKQAIKDAPSIGLVIDGAGTYSPDLQAAIWRWYAKVKDLFSQEDLDELEALMDASNMLVAYTLEPPPPPEPPPAWVQPTGAQDAYPIGAIVTHVVAGRSETTWESKIAANTTTPGGDGTFDRWWAPVTDTGNTNPQPWTQPLPGVIDPHQIGDRVTDGGKTWENTVANNVWKPGVYGWVEVA
jgi:hypothetical protein